MTEVIKKWDVVDMLTALENDFQKYKPFQGNEEAMYRKVCEVEIAIGKMDNIALIESDLMAEKIEMKEALIAELRAQIEAQHDIIHDLEMKAKRLEDKVDEFGRERDVLKAQMDVVRMIFGGRGNE